MEKASNKDSTKLSKMLQKALSIGHGAAPFSPGRDLRHHRTNSTANRGYFFSSPMTPLVPIAARVKRKTLNHAVWAEPTSPKVSCIGQIKLAKPKCPNRTSKNPKTDSSLLPFLIKEENKGSFSKLKRLFSTARTPSRKSNSTASPAASKLPNAAVEAVVAPSLGKMNKFSRSRGALGGFDWKVEIMKQEESDDKDVMIPCSVRLPRSQSEGLNLCTKPKSEVNLWKRRSMDRPKPLQLKATY